MLSESARNQGALDCLAKFAIDANSLNAMQDNYGHFGPQAFNEILKGRLHAEGSTLPTNFDQQVATNNAFSANEGGVVGPEANKIPAGDSRWGPAPVKPRAPVPGAPLPAVPAPGQKPTITAPSFAAPATHAPPVAYGVPVGAAARTGVARNPLLAKRPGAR